MSRKIFFRAPALALLGSRLPDSRKLAVLHDALRPLFPEVDRVAAALYDPKTRTAATFVSSGGATPLALYESRLDEAPSLRRVFRERRIRIVNDMEIFAEGTRKHTLALRGAGYKSSAVFPIVEDDRVLGFIFLNSRRPNAFPPARLLLLEAFARLAADATTARIRAASLLRAALRTAAALVHARDPETGNHLERMARYCRIIAQELARTGRYRLDDERVRAIEDFAPLHDVGKIGIPDRILLKPGPLTAAERRVMRTHTTIGRDIVDALWRRFGAAFPARASALRQIAEHHHEAIDGSGYPGHQRGRRISIEARIAAVADVFDALTSARSYKDAWTVDEAFAALERLGRTKLDRDCVRALVVNRPLVERVRRRFRDAGRLPLRARDLGGRPGGPGRSVAGLEHHERAVPPPVRSFLGLRGRLARHAERRRAARPLRRPASRVRRRRQEMES